MFDRFDTYINIIVLFSLQQTLTHYVIPIFTIILTNQCHVKLNINKLNNRMLRLFCERPYSKLSWNLSKKHHEITFRYCTTRCKGQAPGISIQQFEALQYISNIKKAIGSFSINQLTNSVHNQHQAIQSLDVVINRLGHYSLIIHKWQLLLRIYTMCKFQDIQKHVLYRSLNEQWMKKSYEEKYLFQAVKLKTFLCTIRWWASVYKTIVKEIDQGCRLYSLGCSSFVVS